MDSLMRKQERVQTSWMPQILNRKPVYKKDSDSAPPVFVGNDTKTTAWGVRPELRTFPQIPGATATKKEAFVVELTERKPPLRLTEDDMTVPGDGGDDGDGGDGGDA